MTTKILHLADLHLDRPFTGLAIVSREVPARRREQLRQVLRKVVDMSHDLNVHYLTIGGDLYEHERVTPDTASFLQSEFERAQPAQVIVAPGNHDPYTIDSVYRRTAWPPNVRVATEPRIRLVSDDHAVRVYAAAHPTMDFRRNILADVRLEKGEPNILVLHASETTAVPVSMAGVCPIYAPQCARAGFSLALLGHFHKSVSKTVSDVRIVYPGSPDPLDFSEAGPHYAVLAEIEGNNISVTRRETHLADYRAAEIDISAAQSRNDVAKLIAEWIRSNDAQQAYIRVTLVGAVSRDLDLSAHGLRAACRNEAAFLRIEMHTHLSSDVDPEEPTVRGRFVRRMRKLIEEASSEAERLEHEHALVYGLAALEGREVRRR